MTWNELFPKSCKPDLGQIAGYVANPVWQELGDFISTAYGAVPQIEHSTCSGAPGWNVKYKISSRSLCTLYPHEGFFTCLVCIGSRETAEVELLLPACCAYTREVYNTAKPFNGTRWLMIDVTSQEILDDVKKLLCTRIKPKRSLKDN